MKHYIRALIIFGFLLLGIPLQVANAQTLEDQLNNLVGPKQQYNTMLSPVYLQNNKTEQYISPQNGELSLTQTDYELPGRNGLDLQIKRIYKSDVSNVQEMKVKYVNGAWVDYVYSDDKTSSFYEDRYNLGIGMRFSFPMIEVRKNSDGTSTDFLHTESGDVYHLRADTLNGAPVMLPEGQTIKDVVVTKSTVYSNGQSDGTSKFVMTEKAGKKTYFADDGRILGIVDRYGNTIKFEYTTLSYVIDGQTITKKLISKITDTVGRVTTIEYKEDSSLTVGPITNHSYSASDSYKASQNPNNTDSGDLQGKFQVIVHLPGSKQIVYDKSAVLVSNSKHVIRTRLQRVYDVDGLVKYHLWYEQPDLGFTYMNGKNYSVYNRYEHLVQIDYTKTNRIKRFVYNTYTKQLNQGSMQYRKIFETDELVKKSYDPTQSKFLDRFVIEIKDKSTYSYTNEPDGFGTAGYLGYDENYLKKTFRYSSQITELNGSSTKYTYDGIHELLTTEDGGKDHKEIITTERDEMKLIKQKQTLMYQIVNGQQQGEPVKKIENYRYDEYGNLTNYTGPEAARDDSGYPLDTEHTVVYTYAYDKFHILTSKTWKKDKDTTSQILYDVDNRGNVIKETKVNTGDSANWIKTDYRYDSYGNMTQKSQHAGSQSFVTNYEYGIDANGTDVKGAYLTKKYTAVNGIASTHRYAYDFNTGNLMMEIDPVDNRTNYAYDVLSRVIQVIQPDLTIKTYDYLQNPYADMKVQYTDPKGTVFLYTYDILGDLLHSDAQADGQTHTLKNYTYDAKGNKTKETDANGNSILFTYDSKYRLLRKTYMEKGTVDKGSFVIRYSLDKGSDTPILVTTTDQDGYVKKYHYDILNQLVKLETTPDNSRFYATTYTYDYVGNKLSETDAKGGLTRYAYDHQGRLVNKVDALGNETSYVYNALDKISLQTEPGGKITEILYDEAGRMSEQKIYARGSEDFNFTKYTYDLAGNAIRVRLGQFAAGADSIASDISYTYDSMNRKADEYQKIDTAHTAHIHFNYDPNGNKVKEIHYVDIAESQFLEYSYDYDYAGRMKSESGAFKVANGSGGFDVNGSYAKTYVYDDEGNLTKQQVENGNGTDVTTYAYNYLNKVITMTEPYTDNQHTKQTTSKYDKRGNLLSEAMTIQGHTVTTSFTYDGLGNKTNQVDPLGHSTRYVYDENGNLIKKIDPRYLSAPADQAPGIEYAYDALNRLVKTSAFDGTSRIVTDYREYDGRGNLTLEADGEGYNESEPTKSIGKTTVYDVHDFKIAYISAQTAADNRKNGTHNVTASYTYNAIGNMLSQSDALGNTTFYKYDLNGMLKETRYPDGKQESYAYDLTGKIRTAKIDRAGYTTTTYNTVFGKPYRIDYPDDTHTTFAYSAKGELTESVDPAGNRTLYTYDPSGNVTAKREFIRTEGTNDIYKLTQSMYDEANRLIEQETFENSRPLAGGNETAVSAGDKVQYTYDKAGRLTQISGPFGRQTVNVYDFVGNLIAIKQKTTGSDEDVKRFAYDVQSRIISESTLVKMSELEPQYLAGANFDNEYFDRVQAITFYAYYKNGLIMSKQDPLGATTAYAYDFNGNLTKKTDPLLNATEYRYDGNGNLTAEINAKGVSTTYDYDSLYRLIRKHAPVSDGSTATTRYLYDAMGNLIKQISPNQYDPAKDTAGDALSLSGFSYTYDAMNRRTSTVSPDGKGMEYIGYDANGQVQKVVDGLRYTGDLKASPGTEYAYDGLGEVVKKSDALGGIILYAYDVLGHILRQTDAEQHTTRFAYNPDGTLAQTTFADGGTVYYTYDKLGRIIAKTDQLGHTTLYSYNAFGKEKTITDPYGKTMESTYDLVGNLVSQKDKRSSTTLFKYDMAGRLIEKRSPLQFDASGNVVYAVESYDYDELGNLTRKTLADSKDKTFVRQFNYTYYDNNLVETVSDSSGAYTKHEYDLNGNVIRKEQLRDAGIMDVQQFAYDNQDRLIKDMMLVDEQDIADTGNIPNIANLRDSEYPGKIRLTTGYEYDVLGNKIKEISSRAYAYLSADTANRDAFTVTFAYDALNRLEKTIRKQNGADIYIQYSYDKVGNKIAQRNERGFVTTYAYDSANRLISVNDPLHQLYAYQYDKAGNKTAETNARGETLVYAYDKLNRLVTTTDAYNVVINQNVYDANGNVVKKMDAKGYLSAANDADRYGWTYTYDLANRLTKSIDPELASQNIPELFTATYQYNAAGEKIAETDALHNTTMYDYDAAGRLVQVTDPLGNTILYSYDYVGNKLYMVDGRGKTTQFAYGAFGILIEAINADDKKMQYGYDLALNVTVMIDRNGNHTRYTYDNRNLMLSKTVDETGDAIQYTYDENGNRATMIDASGISGYTYDENDQLLNVTKNGAKQITYTYDEVGNIATVIDQTEFTTMYAYDKSNRMSTVGFSGKTISYTYDENGNRIAIHYAGGVTESYTYDKNNRLLKLTNTAPGGSVISSYAYTYDNTGRQNTKTDEMGTTRYRYDATGRILEVDAPGKTTVYAYDGAGNRQSMHETYTSEQPSSYVDPNTKQPLPYILKKSEYVYTNANQLLKLTEMMYDATDSQVLEKTTNYLYDANGNELREKVSYVLPYNKDRRQTSGGNVFGDGISGDISTLIESVSNTFDGFNRLVKSENIKGGNRSTVTFVYNGDDLRTMKIVQSSEEGYAKKVTNYIYDRQHVVLETDATQTVPVRYIRGVNYIARMDAMSKLSYYLFNGHGDVVQTVDETGSVENRYDYDIFGNPILTIEIAKNEIRYASEFFDEESGLYYLRARYYDPYIGRFISEDSYWGEDTNPLSLNLYTYAFNDPIMYFDPTGHISQNQQKYLNNLVANGTSGQAAWAKNELKKAKDENQKKYLNNLISSGTSGQAAWAKNELNKMSSDSHTPAKSQAQTQAQNKAEELSKQLAKLESGNSEIKKDVFTLSANANSQGGYGEIKNNVTSLSTYAKSQGGKVSWNNQTGVASVTLNGIMRRFDIDDYKVVDGRIQIDPKQFDSAFKARVTLFQHGVNANRSSFQQMTESLGDVKNVVDLGVISNGRIDYNIGSDDKVQALFDKLKLNSNDSPTYITDKLLAHGYNVNYRTEFSNPTGEHFEQIGELSRYINLVTHKDEKVNLVGHSKGGLVSIGYTAFHPGKVNKVITINTPYKPNKFAKESVKAIDKAYAKYKEAIVDYQVIDPGVSGLMEKKLKLAKTAFDKAMNIGTSGSQTDYEMIGGLRDLAGETPALNNIRRQWNTQQANGNLSSIQAYAIATDSYEYNGTKGDGVVSLESQRGAGFQGIKPITLTLSGKDRNNVSLSYSHIGILDEMSTIYIVRAILGY